MFLLFFIFCSSTSISNVAGASLSRRSSERELNDSGSKKRATSASGTDRHEGKFNKNACYTFNVYFI